MYELLADTLRCDLFPALTPIVPCDDIIPTDMSPVTFFFSVSGSSMFSIPPSLFALWADGENVMLSWWEGMKTEKRPKRWLDPKTGTLPMEMRLCELSHPWMCMPESYSELVCTPGSCLMKLTGSVLPKICGRDWIMSAFMLVTPSDVFFIAEACLRIVNVVLSRCRYKESVCAPASVPM